MSHLFYSSVGMFKSLFLDLRVQTDNFNMAKFAKFSYTILVYYIKAKHYTKPNHPNVERREVLHMDYSSDKLELNYMLITRNHERIDDALTYSLSILLLSGETYVLFGRNLYVGLEKMTNMHKHTIV
jgi:hypothetical protein